MTSARRPWIVAALAGAIVALSATAIAQNAPVAPAPHAHRHDTGGTHAGHHADRAARMQAHRAEHQARLKERLQLAPAQEPAWNAFVQGMQPPARPDRARDGWADLTTPQRLDRMEALKTERDQAMRQRHDAIRAFYAQLSPAQQKTFDEEGLGGWHRAGMKRDGHGHRHGMHGMPRM